MCFPAAVMVTLPPLCGKRVHCLLYGSPLVISRRASVPGDHGRGRPAQCSAAQPLEEGCYVGTCCGGCGGKFPSGPSPLIAILTFIKPELLICKGTVISQKGVYVR